MNDTPVRGIDLAETAAMTASLLCMVHCLLLPLVIAALPVLSRALTLPEQFHAGVLIFAAPTALFALALGRRQHGRIAPMLIGTAGIGLLWTALALPHGETILTAMGSSMLIGAHLANWRLRHSGHD